MNKIITFSVCVAFVLVSRTGQSTQMQFDVGEKLPASEAFKVALVKRDVDAKIILAEIDKDNMNVIYMENEVVNEQTKVCTIRNFDYYNSKLLILDHINDTAIQAKYQTIASEVISEEDDITQDTVDKLNKFDRYVMGVVLAELGAVGLKDNVAFDGNKERYIAQAVAARNFTVYGLQNPGTKMPGYSFVDEKGKAIDGVKAVDLDVYQVFVDPFVLIDDEWHYRDWIDENQIQIVKNTYGDFPKKSEAAIEYHDKIFKNLLKIGLKSKMIAKIPVTLKIKTTAKDDFGRSIYNYESIYNYIDGPFTAHTLYEGDSLDQEFRNFTRPPEECVSVNYYHTYSRMRFSPENDADRKAVRASADSPGIGHGLSMAGAFTLEGNGYKARDIVRHYYEHSPPIIRYYEVNKVSDNQTLNVGKKCWDDTPTFNQVNKIPEAKVRNLITVDSSVTKLDEKSDVEVKLGFTENVHDGMLFLGGLNILDIENIKSEDLFGRKAYDGTEQKRYVDVDDECKLKTYSEVKAEWDSNKVPKLKNAFVELKTINISPIELFHKTGITPAARVAIPVWAKHADSSDLWLDSNPETYAFEKVTITTWYGYENVSGISQGNDIPSETGEIEVDGVKYAGYGGADTNLVLNFDLSKAAFPIVRGIEAVSKEFTQGETVSWASDEAQQIRNWMDGPFTSPDQGSFIAERTIETPLTT
jgi:hypothetical protein